MTNQKTLSGIAVLLLLQLGTLSESQAFNIATDDPNLNIRWDNTLKYSAAWRLKDPSATLISDINQDDGDRNFKKGLISNRVDLLTEFDVKYQDIGARLSGAAWYDSIYNRTNDNNSPGTANAYSVPYNEFTNAAKKLHGRKGELLDAFVFGKAEFGEATASFRVGKHSLLWGESLFFGDNGIAGKQSPMDYAKLLSVPNSQFKELIRPIEQLSGQIQVSPHLSFGAYYQLKWEENIFPAVGSYFSRGDVLGDGTERLIAGAPVVPGGGPLAFFHQGDLRARNSGQGGLQMRYHDQSTATDYGLYAIRYHDKNQVFYLRPSATPDVVSGNIGQLQFVYPENIKAYGASFSTSGKIVNLAGEISVRRNTPLVSAGDAVVVMPGVVADNRDNPLYAIGNSLHAQVSTLSVLERTSFWDTATFLGEVAWNRRTSITRNAGALDPTTTRDAWGFRFIFTPLFYQVMPGLDVGIPVGLGYNPKGKSSTVLLFNGGQDKGGDFSIGLSGDYFQTWKFGLNYSHFFGSEGTFLNPAGLLSAKQALRDRDFVSLSVQRTF